MCCSPPPTAITRKVSGRQARCHDPSLSLHHHFLLGTSCVHGHWSRRGLCRVTVTVTASESSVGTTRCQQPWCWHRRRRRPQGGELMAVEYALDGVHHAPVGQADQRRRRRRHVHYGRHPHQLCDSSVSEPCPLCWCGIGTWPRRPWWSACLLMPQVGCRGKIDAASFATTKAHWLAQPLQPHHAGHEMCGVDGC